MGFAESSGADETSVSNTIDSDVASAWQSENIKPVTLAVDAEFLRRVHLDLVGTLATFEETVAFLDNDQADKRRKLIDRLLADPRLWTASGVSVDSVRSGWVLTTPQFSFTFAGSS